MSALRIALSLRVLAAPAVARFCGSSVQGEPPSHHLVEALWHIDARSMAKSSAKYINEVFIRPREHSTSSSWSIFDTAGATRFVRLSELRGLFLPKYPA